MTAPLNILQRYMLKHQLADPASCMYSIPARLRLAPDIDPVRFAAAWNRVTASFEILRARLAEDGRGGFFGRDTRALPPPVGVLEVSDGEFRRMRDRVEPFDLFREPMVRAVVCRTPSLGNWIVFDFHHLAFDGFAILAFNRRVERAYEDPAAPIPSDGAFRRLRELDEEARSERFRRAERYWEETYGGTAWATCPKPDLDGADVTAQGELFFQLPVSVDGLWRICREKSLLPNQLVQAAVLKAIAEDNSRRHTLVGWTCHGRSVADRETGLPLMKDLVLGMDAELEDDEFLHELRRRHDEALRASVCPWAVTESCPLPDLIVDILYQGDLRSGVGHSRRLYVADPDERDGFGVGSQNVLDVEVFEDGNGLSAYFDYAAGRYSPARITSFRDRFLRTFGELLR